MVDSKTLIYSATEAALLAGKKVLEIYNTDFDVYIKNDASPVTNADFESNKIIKKVLAKHKFPIISEESKSVPYSERLKWNYFWLIDPIDGTKEFINKKDEFTVNIALIKKNTPVLGVVYAPMTSELYTGDSFFLSRKINVNLNDFHFSCVNNIFEKSVVLPKNIKRDNLVILSSRSHVNQITLDYIDTLKKDNKNLEIVIMGSSLKICKIAEGEADIYPRLGPTKEWDTAASHAILKYSGGNLLDTNGCELLYNKSNFYHSNFIASISK